jgi:hypothetical protein
VGDGGKWSPFEPPPLDSNRSKLLEALVDSKVFGHKLKDVDVSDCTVTILKGTLPAGVDEPTAADEAPDKVLELRGAKTLETVAKAAGTGDQLFIRVRLPVEAAVQLPAVAVAHADGALLPVMTAAAPGVASSFLELSGGGGAEHLACLHRPPARAATYALACFFCPFLVPSSS